MGKTPTKRALYRNQEESDSTMYQDYPKHKPFINEEYERPVHKPVSSYPEGNRTGNFCVRYMYTDPILIIHTCRN